MAIFSALEKHNPRKSDYVIVGQNLLINAKNFYDGIEMIINSFNDKIFPINPEEGLLNDEDVFRDDEDEDGFYSHGELATIPELPISENEEETPRDIPNLETEESTTQKRSQSARGLKVLTPQQMLSRLPISLAQLKAENNSEKLENEIRQLLYCLYRSKKLGKTIYNNLINAILK